METPDAPEAEFIPLHREPLASPWMVPILDPRGFVLWTAFESQESAEASFREQQRAITAPPILAELQTENAALHKQLADATEELKRQNEALQNMTALATETNQHVATLLKVLRRIV